MANTIVKSQTSILDMVIRPISKLTETWSPEVSVHGIPWKVEVRKHADENSLAVHLNCANEDDSSDWSVPAYTTIKLMSFTPNDDAYVYHVTPFVFRPSEVSFGCSAVISWDELMDQNKYVRNDTIQLKIKITAEDPNYVDRSILTFDNIDKSCDCGSHATFRLKVTNVENLLAVCCSPFIVRGLSWILAVHKRDNETKLGIMLELIGPTEEASCKMKMSVKLLSSKHDVDPIKEFAEKQIEIGGILHIRDIASWDDLFKSKNGYVKNNSITLEVKLKADKPDGVAVIGADPINAVAAKRGRFECSICLEDIYGQDTSSTTPCGHIFCTDCIKKAIKSRKVCPMCKKAVKSLQRVYLPVSK